MRAEEKFTFTMPSVRYLDVVKLENSDKVRNAPPPSLRLLPPSLKVASYLAMTTKQSYSTQRLPRLEYLLAMTEAQRLPRRKYLLAMTEAVVLSLKKKKFLISNLNKFLTSNLIK